MAEREKETSAAVPVLLFLPVLQSHCSTGPRRNAKNTGPWYNTTMDYKVWKKVDIDRIGTNRHVVLGLSGGPDSVFLLHMLLKMAEERHLTLHPVHVNHQIRPGDAEADQRFVEHLCEER